MNRLVEHYRQTVVPSLMKEFGYSTPMEVPRLRKIVLNVGVGEMVTNSKAMDYVVYGITQISGQKPVVRKAKKAIASFKLKENLPVGCMVTLRKDKMYNFLERLISVALPRVRDFRGTPNKGFDGRGNYTLGVREQIVFPEVNVDKLDKIRGMDVTFVTTAKSDQEGMALLKYMGIPFRGGA